MRMSGLGLAALFVLLVGCAEKSAPPEPAQASPPPVTVEPSAPVRSQPPPPPARPPAPPPPPAAKPAPTAPAPLPPPAEPPAIERPPAASVLYVGVQRANFRQGPDLKARILAVVTKGTKLTVLEKSGQWYRVRLDDGKEGWVAESVTSTKPD